MQKMWKTTKVVISASFSIASYKEEIRQKKNFHISNSYLTRQRV